MIMLKLRQLSDVLNSLSSHKIKHLSPYNFQHAYHISQSVSSAAQSCLALCNPMDCSMPGFPVHHQLPEFTQTHVCWVSDAIQPSHPLLSLSSPTFNLSQPQGLFKWVISSIRWPKYWSFSFNISPTSEYSGLITLKIDWYDLLAVQGTFRSVLQHHSPKTSIFQHSAFFTVQLSQPYVTTRKTTALTIWTFVGRVRSLLFNTLFGFAWFHSCSRYLQWFWSPRGGNLSLLPHFPFYLPCSNGAGCHDLVLFCFNI